MIHMDYYTKYFVILPTTTSRVHTFMTSAWTLTSVQILHVVSTQWGLEICKLNVKHLGDYIIYCPVCILIYVCLRCRQFTRAEQLRRHHHRSACSICSDVFGWHIFIDVHRQRCRSYFCDTGTQPCLWAAGPRLQVWRGGSCSIRITPEICSCRRIARRRCWHLERVLTGFSLACYTALIVANTSPSTSKGLVGSMRGSW